MLDGIQLRIFLSGDAKRETGLGNIIPKHKEKLSKTRRYTSVNTKKYEEFDERIYWFLQDTLWHKNKKKSNREKPNERDK